MSAAYPTREERDAARKYLEHDHAAQTLQGGPAREANRHAEQLDEQHPRARDIALTGTARELGELPKHLRAHQMRSRKQAGISTEHAARIRSGYRSGPPSGSPPERQGANPRPNARPQTRAAAARSTAGDWWGTATDTSWGGLVVQMFAWGMGLSLAYLLITRAAGAAKLAQGGVNVTRAVVSAQIDPLNPSGHVAVKH